MMTTVQRQSHHRTRSAHSRRRSADRV